MKKLLLAATITVAAIVGLPVLVNYGVMSVPLALVLGLGALVAVAVVQELAREEAHREPIASPSFRSWPS